MLVTGASTGIGLAISRRLLGGPHRLVLTARASSLSRFHDEGIHESGDRWLRPLDVVDDSDRRRLVAEVEARWGGVDVLINNAGISYRAVVEHMSQRDERDQMDINYFGPMELIRLVLPGMRARRSGHIINVSSVSGMMAMPTMSAYSASKFALEGASESLWYELRPWGIHVTLVQPGFVRSSSFERVLLTAEAQRSLEADDEAYHQYYEHMSRFVAWMMRHAPSDADDVATEVLGILGRRNPPLRHPATVDAWLFYFLRRLLPRGVYHHILYRGLPSIHRWGPRAGPTPSDGGSPAPPRRSSPLPPPEDVT